MTPTKGDPSEIHSTDKATSATDGTSSLVQDKDYTLIDGGAVFSDSYLAAFSGERTVKITIGNKYYEFKVTGTKPTESDKAAAEKVNAILSGLPDDISLEDEPKVAAARKAYDALTEVQKKLISEENLGKLLNAEKAIATLHFEADVANAKAVKVTGVKGKSIRGKKINVSWKPAFGITSYKVYYSTNKKMKKGVRKLTVTGSTKATLKKLKKGKTYYIAVRAVTEVENKATGEKVKVEGAKSKVKKVKVKR